MNFDRPWTAFALEAECEHFGFARIAKAHNAEIATLRARAERAEANAKLAAFGAWCAEECRESMSDVDGGSAQDAMERTGVLVKLTVTEPCGESCSCAEWGEFPQECYRYAPDVRAAIDAARAA